MKIKINGKFITFFNEIAIEMELDKVASAFSFLAKYNPENPIHKEIFQPISFPRVEIYDDNEELILTGTAINFSFKSQAAPSLVQISGYSLPGLLEDVNIPVSSYPLESLERSLDDVCRRLLPQFGIKYVVQKEVKKQMDIVYPKTIAEPTESVKGYLAKLAAQRNIVMGHTPKGELLFHRPNAKAAPVYTFNTSNCISMEFSVNGQGLHSEISVIRTPSEKAPEGFIETIKNTVSDLLGIGEKTELPRFVNANRSRSGIINSFRPKTVVLTSGTNSPIDAQLAVTNQLASELSNISLNIVVPNIISINPGEIIEVENIEVYINIPTKFIVNKVVIAIDQNGQYMSITALIPEAFTGEQPKKIFQS